MNAYALNSSDQVSERDPPVCLTFTLTSSKTFDINLSCSPLRKINGMYSFHSSLISDTDTAKLALHLQDPSLRLVPAAASSKTASIQDTANTLGLHDTLKYGPRSLATEVKSQSTIRDRLSNVRLSTFYTMIARTY